MAWQSRVIRFAEESQDVLSFPVPLSHASSLSSSFATLPWNPFYVGIFDLYNNNN